MLITINGMPMIAPMIVLVRTMPIMNVTKAPISQEVLIRIGIETRYIKLTRKIV